MNPLHLSDQFQPPNHSKNGLSSGSKMGNPHGGHIHSMNDVPVIRDVWEDNFYEEFSTIMSFLDKYKVVAMDTEFPGIVYKLTEVDLSSLPSYQEIEYRTIKMNVDKLKVIQVGISFANESGHIPHGVSTWQFNFKFDIDSDESSKESIQLLSHSGIQFEKHKSKGINPQLFAEHLISSGLALNEDVKWVTFHGGFDFAYLIKILHGQALPDDETGFYGLLAAYFPSFFDVKCMIRDIDSIKTGGLNKLASDLNVKRIGPQHQAGSDSLLTLSTFFKLKETYLKGVPEYKHANVLYGIGSMGDEDYIWQNYVVSDYSYSVLNSYGMNSIPMMNHSYYPQNESVYSSMVNANYNLNFPVVYNSFGPGSYVEPNPKPKKYETSMRKLKNQV